MDSDAPLALYPCFPIEQEASRLLRHPPRIPFPRALPALGQYHNTLRTLMSRVYIYRNMRNLGKTWLHELEHEMSFEETAPHDPLPHL